MKKLFTLLVITLALAVIGVGINESFGQAVSINSTGAAPNGNSILDVSSTSAGALLPRMTTAQRTGMTLGAGEEGMTVFDTQLDAYFFWDGAAWVQVLTGSGVSLDAAYDGGTANSGNGRIIEADQGPVDIQNSSTFSLVTDESVGIGINSPTNKLHVFETTSTGGELVLGKFEFNTTNSNGTTGGIQVVGERGNTTNEVAFIEFFNNNGSETLSRISTRGAGGGELMIQLGDGSGGLIERMVLDNDGNLQLDGLIEATSSVLTSTTAGVIQSLPAGNNDDVLRISGGTIGWGPATVSTLPLANLGGGSNGDVLYHDGSNWVALSPGGSGPYVLTTPGTGNAPSWSGYSAVQDNLGDHTATTDLDLNGNDITGTGNININGKVVSDGINETSDARFKKNVQSISDALTTVLNLEGVTYNWRTKEFPEKQFSSRKEYGVIAQQIEKYVPELVHTNVETGYKSVQYSHMVPLLIEAIKEQQFLLSQQDSEISQLKASVESLSHFISTSKK